MHPFPFGYVRGWIRALADIVPALTHMGEVIKGLVLSLKHVPRPHPMAKRRGPGKEVG